MGLSEIIHKKEIKQKRSESILDGYKNKAYAFGKINKVYTLSLSYGQEQVLFPALIEGNMSMKLRYSIGPDFAFLKPYYLDLLYWTYTPEELIMIQTEKLNPSNIDKFLSPGSIAGRATWETGIKETAIIPGVSVKIAFIIEPSKEKRFIKAISFGGQAAYYLKPLTIMANQKDYTYHLSLFVGFHFGGRW